MALHLRRTIICGMVGHFSSNTALFTGFWLGWVGKALFFPHIVRLGFLFFGCTPSSSFLPPPSFLLPSSFLPPAPPPRNSHRITSTVHTASHHFTSHHGTRLQIITSHHNTSHHTSHTTSTVHTTSHHITSHDNKSHHITTQQTASHHIVTLQCVSTMSKSSNKKSHHISRHIASTAAAFSSDHSSRRAEAMYLAVSMSRTSPGSAMLLKRSARHCKAALIFAVQCCFLFLWKLFSRVPVQ